MKKDYSDHSWNANLGVLEQVTFQMQDVRDALNHKDEARSPIYALEVFSQMLLLKMEKLPDDVVDALDQIKSLQIESQIATGAKRSSSLYSANQKMMVLFGKIIRLMVESKLLQLEPDARDPVEETLNDY